ncbi:SRPBCC domain-containing protein [Dyadobacter sp. CY326]|uniref:SRPBCC domain-containing protein n=1 Tax=Dyadobacter sp. CY326 TaxID=2907300 RepID=UPI001F19793F|nr:SRPBCC domain-containing protein [Dyadobacter sp. CY326]MCE7067081.1 SRPBCC domain-containing protein [Dyadobacter sp. CY326]
METAKLTARASIQIQKSPQAVYEAIVDPALMSNYFISKGSGIMEEGQTVIWRFPEFDMEFPVEIVKTEKFKQIHFIWGQGDQKALVEIALEAFKKDTVVKIVEHEPARNEAGISWAIGQTEGWSYFLAGLKAFLDHNVRLREGAFAYRFVG